MMMRFLLVTLLLSVGVLAKAQSFEAEIFGGANGTQIDGDHLAGFNKLGLAAGLGVRYPISDNVFTGLQAMYNQKGSRSKPEAAGFFIQRLNYIDVPVYLGWNLWEELHLNTGLVPGVLISDGRDTGFGFKSTSELYSKFGVEYMFEAKYYMLPKVAAGVRWQYALSSSTKNGRWFNNLLGFYLFFGL